jgi:hypothetical protein
VNEPEDKPGSPPGWLRPTPPEPLAGDERFAGVGVSVTEFWRWAFSDLRENTTRGILAEFLVAHAVGAAGRLRKSWENYDLLTPTGVRVEVKSSGYLQSWPQARLSRIGFGKLAGLTWDENAGEWGVRRDVRADVFVFAIQTCTDPASYDGLDVAQWQFYVVPAAAIRGAGYRSAGVEFVRTHATAGPITYDELAQAIEAAGRPPRPPA